MTDAETPVLIAGAGPVGLALAIELAGRGVAATVVEERDGSVAVPKMSQVSTRTIEFCRRWGVAERVFAAGFPKEHKQDFVYVTTMTGYELSRQRFPSFVERPHEPHSPVRSYQCPQIFFDPILRDHAGTLAPVTLRYFTRLESFAEDADGVTAELSDAKTGARSAIRAGYLVGCDGAQSRVREALGIAMDGEGRLDFSISIFFRSAELATLHDKGWARFYRMTDEAGHWGDLIAIDGKDLWRLTVLTGLDPAAPLSAFDADAYMRRAVGRPFAYEVISVLPWERRELVAGAYRKGRVFIAGDAAHQNSPTGGLGMSIGIADAVDLGWKLAARLAGWGGDALLESYEAERRPVALACVAECSRMFRQTTALPGGPDIGRDTAAGAAARAKFVAHIEADMRSGATTMSENFRLGYCYDPSPVVIPDGSAAPDPRVMRFAPSARPGSRAPHAWLAPGKSTLDLFGDGFVLLRFGADDSSIAAQASARGVPLAVHDIADPEIAKLYQRALVLVRPDGHVSWRGDAPPADTATLIDTVRGAIPFGSSAARVKRATCRSRDGGRLPFD